MTPPPFTTSTTTIKITIICTRFGKNLVSGDENAVTADHVTTSPIPLVIVITVRIRELCGSPAASLSGDENAVTVIVVNV